jgi:hypothetical protein
MSKRFLVVPFTFFIVAVFLLAGLRIARGAGEHVVVSEVQVGGITADDEFVELYNPTASDIPLVGWRLSVKSSAGTSTSNLLTTFPNTTIKSHGYFLIAPPEYDAPASKDANYSTSAHIGANNTVVLYSDAGSTIVDMVGMGTAAIKETANAPLPVNNSSIERVSNLDTDNNASDFQIKEIPDPQNSSFVDETPTPTPTEIPAATPTPMLEATPTPTPTETPTPTPTEEPTASPTPTDEPTIEPTPTNYPSPTHVPPGWLKSPVFTCRNPHVPAWVYQLLKFLMPQKFNCSVS